jgi:hypothetical protein
LSATIVQSKGKLYSASSCKELTDEAVPKLFPRFEKAPFFNKTQKNGKKYGFSCPE